MVSKLIRRWGSRGRVCLALSIFGTLAAHLPAETPPKFSDPEVTAYVKTLGDFRDRYCRAAATGEERQLKKMEAEFVALQARAIRLVDKLQPRETKPFTVFVTSCGQDMVDAAFIVNRMPGKGR